MEEATKSAPMMKLLAMEMGMEMGALVKAFYKRYGKEALPIITEVMSQGGVGWGKIMQQMGPVKGMKGVGEAYKRMASMMGLKMEVVELSDKASHFKTSQCSLGIEGASKELCEAMMAADKKAMSTLLGQEVELKILKCIAAGDKECEIIFSRK